MSFNKGGTCGIFSETERSLVIKLALYISVYSFVGAAFRRSSMYTYIFLKICICFVQSKLRHPVQ